MKYSVNRSIVVDADIATVRSHLADFSKWPAWSPWSVLEPKHKSGVDGEMGEIGSSMSWDGDVIGSGSITLTGQSESQLNYDLAFIAPWKSQAKTSFLLEPVEVKEEGGASLSSNGKPSQSTKVTWAMDSEMPFFLFFMIGMIKAMVGMDYDRGLLMLKSVVETGKVDADTSNEGIVDFSGFSYVGLARTSHMDDMPEHMSADFEQLMQACKRIGSEPAHILSIYNKVKFTKQLFSYTSSVAGVDAEALKTELASAKLISRKVASGEVKSQKMMQIKHRGSYKYLGNAWSMGHLTIRANKLKHNGAPFEYYHNDPADTPENELLTSIYFPIKG